MERIKCTIYEKQVGLSSQLGPKARAPGQSTMPCSLSTETIYLDVPENHPNIRTVYPDMSLSIGTV